jgi:hypothetical protein
LIQSFEPLLPVLSVNLLVSETLDECVVGVEERLSGGFVAFYLPVHESGDSSGHVTATSTMSKWTVGPGGGRFKDIVVGLSVPGSYTMLEEYRRNRNRSSYQRRMIHLRRTPMAS